MNAIHELNSISQFNEMSEFNVVREFNPIHELNEMSEFNVARESDAHLYSRKFNREELSNMHPVDAYKVVLFGRFNKILPRGFWEGDLGLAKARVIIKWLIEENLELSEEELKDQFSFEFLCNYKLRSMLRIVFSNSVFNVIDNSYPRKFKPWEFRKVPMHFWTKETGIEAVRWLIEERYRFDDEEVLKYFNYELFRNNGLHNMLKYVFDYSPYKALNSAYPNKYKAWQFQQSPRHCWDSDANCIEAIKWLIEDRLKFSDYEIKTKLSTRLFKENGLGGMMARFNNSPFSAVNLAYPNRFKREDFKYSKINVNKVQVV